MKPKLILITGILLVIGSVGFALYLKQRSTTARETISFKSTPNQITDQQFITANPLALSQIKAISKFRSCAGHDFSGVSYEGMTESDRSMKHYVVPINSLVGSIGKIKIYAPVTGTVDHYELPHEGTGGANGTQRGSGIWIRVTNIPVDVVLAHFDPAIPIQEGINVTAGQLIGYANLGNSAGNDFDLVVQGEGRAEAYYSIFKHMTPSVLAQYAAHGISLDNIIVSKDYRDAHPCGYPGKNQEGNGKNTDYSQDFVEFN